MILFCFDFVSAFIFCNVFLSIVVRLAVHSLERSMRTSTKHRDVLVQLLTDAFAIWMKCAMLVSKLLPVVLVLDMLTFGQCAGIAKSKCLDARCSLDN